MASGESILELVDRQRERPLEEQLALLANITGDFASSLDIDETLNTALHRFLLHMSAEAASVFLLESDGTELVCHKCAGPVEISGLRLDASQGVVGKCVRNNACQMIRDVREEPDFSRSVDADTGFVTRSILCVPLVVKGQSIGAIELINKLGGDGLFNEQDRDLVTALAGAASLAIHNARMAKALVEQERIRRELELAREIQRKLLPPPGGPEFPVCGINIPALEVSGDFYDFLELPDGRIYFNVADVSGKGMNAALLMAKTSSLLRCLVKTCDDVGELMSRVNDELCETATHGMFVTIVSGFIEPEGDVLTISNAGHQAPLFHHPDGHFEEVAGGGPPLGIIARTEFPVVSMKLAGGSLYLFTDGVTESSVTPGKHLDVGGLQRLIEDATNFRGFQRLERIIAELCGPGRVQHDDITMMLIERPVN